MHIAAREMNGGGEYSMRNPDEFIKIRNNLHQEISVRGITVMCTAQAADTVVVT